MSRRHSSSGFTLVEISVVILVLGIVLATTVVGAAHLVRSSRLTGAANTLVADLRFAHNLATTRQQTVRVVFGGDSYSIQQTSPATTLLTRDYPRDISYSPSATPQFFPYGLSSAVSISLTSAEMTKTLQLAANGNVTH